MSGNLLDCHDESRRGTLLASPRWNGIDYLEVGDDQRSLQVHFFGAAPVRRIV